MKAKLFVYVLPILLCSSFLKSESPDFQLKVKGIDHRNVSKSGILTTELNTLWIEIPDSQDQVNAFDITLARGTRAVYFHEIRGTNSIELNALRGKAKSGDRFVIEIKEVVEPDESIIKTEHIITIPIN